MTFVRASAILLVGVFVCSTSPAAAPDAVIETGLDSLIRPPGGLAGSILAQALVVRIVTFDAVVDDGAVVLRWETAAEIDNEGFNVLRGTDPHGEFQAVNDPLIPAAGGPAFGAAYEYVDTTVEAGTTYYYLLEDVATSGAVSWRGADACRYDAVNPGSPCTSVAVTIPEPPDPPADLIFGDGFELGSTSAWSSTG